MNQIGTSVVTANWINRQKINKIARYIKILEQAFSF